MHVLTTIVNNLTYWVDPQSYEDCLRSQALHSRIYCNGEFFITEVEEGWTWKDTFKGE